MENKYKNSYRVGGSSSYIHIGDCGHVVDDFGRCSACRDGIRMTDIYLYRYHDNGKLTPWLVGTSGRGRFARNYLRRATAADRKHLRKLDEWHD